ncbi:MAG: thioredoxin family protein [Phycisphaerales bacterium]|nr:thioredoxin family protein [Phycisphaerales bacterium]
MTATLRVLTSTLLALLLGSGSRAYAQPMGFGVQHVQIDAALSTQTVAPGDRLAIAVVFDHDEGYHAHTHDPQIPKAMGDFPAIPTTITLADNPLLTLGRIQWPEEHTVAVDFGFENGPVDYNVYSGRAIAYVPVLVSPDAPEGELSIEIRVGFQACNDTTCDPPSSETRTLTLTVAKGGADIGIASELFSGFDASVYADPDAWGAGVVETEPNESGAKSKFLGLELPPVDSAPGMIVLALLAAVGGFVLNLTPCVLPVIPLKVMAISSHAGEHKSRALALGFSMALGVVAFWTAIGIPVVVAVAAAKETVADPSQLIFGRWYITLLIGIVIAMMGIGIMGLFQIKLPQNVYKLNPKADSIHGSFLFGIMTAVLGLPCFGFVAGALLAGAAAMPPLLVMTIFVFLGIGMALPYLVLAMFPKLVNRIPRTGPASDLVKQIMGLMMLTAAAYFLGTSVISFASARGISLPWWGKAVHWWIIGLLLVATGGWLIARTYKITKKIGPRLVYPVLAFALMGLGGAAGYDRTMHQYHNIWVDFSPEALDAALARGDVVVLDFTAEWCINCKVLEATVLSQKPVKPALLSAGVVPMVADLTSNSAPGWEKLRSLNQVGIPLLVVYGPGSDEPVWMSNAYTGGQVAEAIREARGAAGSP